MVKIEIFKQFFFPNKQNEKVIKAFNFYFGVNCAKDEEKAEEYCLLACSEDEKLALGMKHLFGWKTEIDEEKAFEIFEQICEENEENKEIDLKILGCSTYFLAKCYHLGKGTKKNFGLAIEIYGKALKLENSESMFRLALLYEKGLYQEGIEKDLNKALDLYEKASDLGHIEAMNNLANLYKEGQVKIGLKKNFKKALLLFEKAANFNNANANYNLALIYEKGDSDEGFQRNMHKSIELLEKSFRFGCFKSLSVLALIYERGDKQSNIERDVDKACYLYFQSFHYYHFQSSKDSFLFLVEKEQDRIVWKSEYHPYWRKSPKLNHTILIVLLISKYRNNVRNKIFQQVFLKGISMKIIKYLCHSSSVEKVNVTLKNKYSQIEICKNQTKPICTIH